MGGITQSTFSFISSQSGSFTSFRRWKKSQISLYFLTLSGSTHMRGSLTRVRLSPPTQQIPSPILGHTVWSTQFIQTESDAAFLVLGGQGGSIQARPLDKSLQIALPAAHLASGCFRMSCMMSNGEGCLAYVAQFVAATITTELGEKKMDGRL